IHCLVPVRRQPDEVFVAIVRIAAGSEPASASDSAKQPHSLSPAASGSTQRLACAGVPFVAISSPTMFVTETATAPDASAGASSGSAREYATTPAPAPP